ncbi:MAG: hypothetical protein IT444_00860 [Phycisphaeraceae bacterium]|nr:hypothetical protein [Phycisphaeraceae bacterium]
MGRPLQICYVLAGSGDDVYADMLYISASMSRRLYADARIRLLCDEVTAPALEQHHSPVLDVVDEVVRVETGMTTVASRSRFVKTSMRQVVQGDFIFLDADALPVQPFHQMALVKEDFAAVRDCLVVPAGQWYQLKLLWRHWTESPPIPAPVKPVYDSMAWNYPPRYYFNTGVMFMRDTPEARRLGQEWHNRWRQQFDKLGIHQDQFSFNSAIHDLTTPIRVLPTRYNAMVRTSPWYAHRAKIFHFFTTGKSPEPGTVLARLVETLQKTRKLDTEMIERFCRSGYPWLTDSLLLRAAAGNYGVLAQRLIPGRRRQTA